MKGIPQGKWITSYAPLAPIRLGHGHDCSNYIIKTIRNGCEFEVDGKLCPIGLGQLVQDGSFPFILALERFSPLIKSRVNCELANRDGEIWYRSTRYILAGEELYTKYSHDNSYWTLQFSKLQLDSLRKALLTAANGTLAEAERILRNFSFTS